MRNSFIQIRINEEERESFRTNAKELNISVTAYIRMLNAQYSMKKNNIDPRKEDDN